MLHNVCAPGEGAPAASEECMQTGLLLQLLPGLRSYGGWQLCPAPPRPAKALRNEFTRSGMRARLPNSSAAALQQCSNAAMQQCVMVEE